VPTALPQRKHRAMQICSKEAVVEGKLIRIGRLDAEGYDFLEDPERAIAAFQQCGSRVDLFTFIQPLSNVAQQYSYPMEWDNMAAIRVTTFDHWLTKQIDFKARNKARKAAKSGVVVKEVPFDDFLIKGISAIYNETPVRQGKPFWHYGKDLDLVRRMNATFMYRSVFLGALFENELIGFVKLVANQDRSQAGLMQIISMMRHRDKAPTNALVAQAVQSCADRGIAHLWYANFLYGKKQADSLADFKRHNGFQKVDVPRYFVPLTLAGRAALRLGLHHKAADWLPESFADLYRRVRKQWYAKKLPRYENAQDES